MSSILNSAWRFAFFCQVGLSKACHSSQFSGGEAGSASNASSTIWCNGLPLTRACLSAIACALAERMLNCLVRAFAFRCKGYASLFATSSGDVGTGGGVLDVRNWGGRTGSFQRSNWQNYRFLLSAANGSCVGKCAPTKVSAAVSATNRVTIKPIGPALEFNQGAIIIFDFNGGFGTRIRFNIF